MVPSNTGGPGGRRAWYVGIGVAALLIACATAQAPDGTDSAQAEGSAGVLTDVWIERDGDASRITLVGLDDPVYTAFLHTDPAALVEDIAAVEAENGLDPLAVYDGLVEQVSVSSFAAEDGEPVTRVEVSLASQADYRITPSSDGLLVDEDVTFAELKGTLMHFIHAFFGSDIKVRFRPHFFPFTEPSAEVDILWTAEDRQGGGVKNQWLEILGCGMVHPEVFRHAGYDSEKYRGFAFGLGIDRIAMVRHSINSIHHMYENDLRFLEQF